MDICPRASANFMDDEIKLKLKTHYGIDAKEIERLRGYYDSNFRIYDGEKNYFVKLFGVDDENAVMFQVDFINACCEADIPAAEVLKTKTGEQHILINGKPFIVQEFLEGELLLDTEHTDILLEHIGKTLGQIHKVSSQQTFKGSKWKQYEWDSAQFHLVEANFEQAKPYLNKECLDLVNAVLTDWKVNTKRFENLRPGVIHNDFQGLNLLVKDNLCSGVVDFGDTLESWFAADVATALTHICLCKAEPFVKMRKFLRGYQTHFNLTHSEHALLPLLARMRATTIVVNHKKDFKENIPKEYKKIFDDAVNVLKLFGV